MDPGLDCLWPRLFVSLQPAAPGGDLLDTLRGVLRNRLGARRPCLLRQGRRALAWDATHHQERLGPPRALGQWLLEQLPPVVSLGLAAHPDWAHRAARSAAPGAIAFHPPWLAPPPAPPQARAAAGWAPDTATWTWVLPPRTASPRTLRRYARRACRLARRLLERDCQVETGSRLALETAAGPAALTVTAPDLAALEARAERALDDWTGPPACRLGLRVTGLAHRYGQGDLFAGTT